MTKDVVAKVFWPSNYAQCKSGYLIGWNLRSFISCVVSVVSNYSLEEIEKALEAISEHPKIKALQIGPPIVLGEIIVNSKDEDDVQGRINHDSRKLDEGTKPLKEKKKKENHAAKEKRRVNVHTDGTVFSLSFQRQNKSLFG
jgi:hypothetical protein